MPKTHTVAQGEYLAKIAAQYGFADFHVIWDHAKNAVLKQKRHNPNVLYEGDTLYIPDKQEKQEGRGTSQTHVFHVKRHNLMLRIVLEDIYDKPIAAAPCELRLKSKIDRVTTDGSGKLEHEITVEDDIAQLMVRDDQTAVAGVRIDFRIGDLDPPEEVTGQKARLANLGYYFGPARNDQDKESAHFRSAVEEFQCDHALKVTGICDAATQTKLKEIHGC